MRLNGSALPLVRAGVKLNDVVLSLPLVWQLEQVLRLPH